MKGSKAIVPGPSYTSGIRMAPAAAPGNCSGLSVQPPFHFSCKHRDGVTMILASYLDAGPLSNAKFASNQITSSEVFEA
jgi:hypothetical protein